MSQTRAWLRREKARERKALLAIVTDWRIGFVDHPYSPEVILEAQDRLRKHHGNPIVPADNSHFTSETRWYL